MIYDCISFCNTIEVLDIRLHELDPYVDKFIIAEHEVTFTGRPKKLWYEENKSQFKKFAKKIIHIIGEPIGDSPDMSGRENTFRRKTFHKNAISRGLLDCAHDDIILFSDADEIPRGTDIAKYRHICHKDDEFVAFWMQMYCWKLNWYWYGKWQGTVMGTYKYLRDVWNCDLDQWRRHRRRGHKVYSGWHFNLTGDTERRVENLLGYEDKYRIFHGGGGPAGLKDYVEKRIKNHLGFGKALRESLNTRKVKVVEIDDSFPEYLVKNQERFRELIE